MAGRRPGRGQTIGVTSLSIGWPTSMPAAVDGEVRDRVAAGAAVGEVDDRVHGAVAVGACWRSARCTVRPWWNATAALRHLDEHRLDAGDLGVGEDVLRLAEEDVDELAQPDRVGARAGTPSRRTSSVEPSNGIHAVTDAVSLIGQYGWSWWASVRAAAGLLVERLVVPEPDRVDAEQLGGGLAEPRVERERPDVGVVLPEVHALHERLLVAALLRAGRSSPAVRARTAAVTAAP